MGPCKSHGGNCIQAYWCHEALQGRVVSVVFPNEIRCLSFAVCLWSFSFSRILYGSDNNNISKCYSLMVFWRCFGFILAILLLCYHYFHLYLAWFLTKIVLYLYHMEIVIIFICSADVWAFHMPYPLPNHVRCCKILQSARVLLYGSKYRLSVQMKDKSDRSSISVYMSITVYRRYRWEIFEINSIIVLPVQPKKILALFQPAAVDTVVSLSLIFPKISPQPYLFLT